MTRAVLCLCEAGLATIWHPLAPGPRGAVPARRRLLGRDPRKSADRGVHRSRVTLSAADSAPAAYWLGETPVQRRKAREKLLTSAKPSEKATSVTDQPCSRR